MQALIGDMQPLGCGVLVRSCVPPHETRLSSVSARKRAGGRSLHSAAREEGAGERVAAWREALRSSAAALHGAQQEWEEGAATAAWRLRRAAGL